MIDRTVDGVIEANSERKARNWATYLTKSMPNLDLLIATGDANEEQRAVIDKAVQVADVFRFKLFNSDAQVVLISDELGTPLEVGAKSDHNGNAYKVLVTGEAVIELKDGTQKQNRPDLYVEAYVPVVAESGDAVAVVEVYMDQTPVAGLFRDNFRDLVILLGVVVIAGFGVPFVAYIVKMRQQVKTGEKVRLLSSVDQLTGLYNRATFFQKVEEARQTSRLDLSRAAVIFVDLDNFKAINDSFGHKAGDGFLRHVGNCISRLLQDGEIAARLGGDEFIILTAERSRIEIADLVEALREAVSEPVRIDGMALTGHLSLGVYLGGPTDMTLKDRMHKADIALYQAKLNGRNTWVLFTPELEEKIARRQFIEECIVAGFSRDRFEVHYQPLIEQAGRRVVGFEALLRLQDGDGNFISPAEFIPIAEEAGEISRIGTWVLEQAITTATTWPDRFFVSVNISTRQFEDGELVETVQRILKSSGLAPHRLELEVTENTLIEREEEITDQLVGLSKTGVSLAMDDFGTGYSSLGYLWKYDFHKLKVDRSFIKSLSDKDDKSRHVLDTIISLGHRLEMTVTVEGIETLDQVNALSTLSCDQFQGFYYGKPMPAGDLTPFFSDGFLAEDLPDQFQSRELLKGAGR